MKNLLFSTIILSAIFIPSQAIATEKVLWCQVHRFMGVKVFSSNCKYITPQEAANRRRLQNTQSTPAKATYRGRNGIRATREDCLGVNGNWHADIKLCTLQD